MIRMMMVMNELKNVEKTKTLKQGLEPGEPPDSPSLSPGRVDQFEIDEYFVPGNINKTLPIAHSNEESDDDDDDDDDADDADVADADDAYGTDDKI